MNTIVKVGNLTKKFNGFEAIKEVNFSANEGEIFGLLGPNGAGKTTTIRTMATILIPSSGTAEICGFDIFKSPEKVRENIGVLTTEIGVYERFTGRENLDYFGRLYGISSCSLSERIEEIADFLDMKSFIDRKSGTYSTGMKQKLAIARSIIHDPKVIIFDEPTAGLDVLASQTVTNFMQSARNLGKCVIFSTHQMFDAEKLCDRVAIIHKGEIVSVDNVDNLKNRTDSDSLESAFLKLINNKT